jgi:hypothetical protein
MPCGEYLLQFPDLEVIFTWRWWQAKEVGMTLHLLHPNREFINNSKKLINNNCLINNKN